MMVVVVPPFSAAKDRKNKTVSAAVAGSVPNPTDHVCQGIDKERTMIQRGRGNKKAPDQAGGPPEQVDQQAVESGRDEVKPVEKADFGILGEVFDETQVRPHMLFGQGPADMREPEAPLQGRMEVFFPV